LARRFKVCRGCGEENLGWAQYCRGCQASLDNASNSAISQPLRVPPSLLVGVLLCAMAFATFWTLFPNTSAGLRVDSTKRLRVLWHKFYGDYGQEWIVGDVRNQSKQTLRHLIVWGEFYDDGGRQITSAHAPLDSAALAPGQISHFKVSAPYAASIDKSWFHFQTPDGQQISFQR